MSRPLEITLTGEEKRSLEKVIRSPSAAVRDVQRARVVLLASERVAQQRNRTATGL